jgi:2-haloacid dehalogenase
VLDDAVVARGVHMLLATRKRVIVFDVNETLLDICALEPLFARLFGDARILRQWFGELVLYSEALTLSGHYVDFAELGEAVLKMLAAVHRAPLGPGDGDRIADGMRHLPPHRDTEPALAMLGAAGFRMATLTNSPPREGKSAADNAGIGHHFEAQFSVDSVHQFKPAARTYGLVAHAFGVEPAGLLLVATHPWDTLGAAAAGWKTALMTRPGNAALPVGPQADIVGPDLLTVAERIIAEET